MPREAIEEAADSKQGKSNDEKKPKQSQASVLVDLAMKDGIKFFHADDEGYAAIHDGPVVETLAVKSRAFRRYLARMYHREHKRAPGSQALQDAVNVLEGVAIFDAPAGEVHVRIAEQNGTIWLDLADADRRVVEITPTGWTVKRSVDCPIRFRRPKAIRALPVPQRGGSLDDLRDLLNVDETGFVLIVACMVAMFRPGWPVPVLLLNSEQGSGKSTLCRIIRALIDPNSAPLRSEPREARDLMIAASNGYVIALDNLSFVQAWLSDLLCRLSTGGGFSTRTLYENDEETIFNALRPVVLNGIEEIATRSDLLDRCVRVSLPTIPEEKRKPESELWRDFDRAAPGILGALLDSVVTALANVDQVQLDRLPRMADFARWVVAAEDALPWLNGRFMQEYTGNRDGVHELAIEGNPIGPVLLDFAHAVNDWTGSASQLLDVLSERAGDGARRKGWPQRANVLSGILSRLAPNFRQLGVLIERDHEGRGQDRRKVVRIRTVPQNTDPTDPDRPQADFDSANADFGVDDGRSGVDPQTIDRPTETALTGSKTDGVDGDDESQTCSKGGDEWRF